MPIHSLPSPSGSVALGALAGPRAGTSTALINPVPTTSGPVLVTGLKRAMHRAIRDR